MMRLGLTIAGTAALAAGLCASAADWDGSAVGHDLANGRAQQALEATRTRLADHPDDPRARFLQGMALAATGEPARAIAVYEN